MTEFQYAGVTSEGKPCQGSVRAPDADTARLRLMGQGITPVRISSDAGSDAPSAGGARGLGLKRKDVLLFTREMAHLKPGQHAAGPCAVHAQGNRRQRAPADLHRQGRGKRACRQVAAPVAAALRKDLGRQYLVLVRAGETSGSSACRAQGADRATGGRRQAAQPSSLFHDLPRHPAGGGGTLGHHAAGLCGAPVPRDFRLHGRRLALRHAAGGAIQ